MPKNTKRILVVDDVTSNRKLLAHIILEMGIREVIQAKSGNLAWEAIKEAVHQKIPFDTIITDIKMMDGDGIELLTRIRSNAPTANTPVFIVTTMSERDKIVKAKTLNANGYILKPFEKEVIEDRLQFLIEGDNKNDDSTVKTT